MLRLPKMRMIVLPVLLTALTPAILGTKLVAQDDPNETPLGDVARSLRRKSAAPQNVIDDDNLSTVMRQAESSHAPGSALKFLMAGEGKGFRVSAPDVTCSLSFTANVKSLLSSQYDQMELPVGEVRKLEGPATIEGDALQVSVFNRTDWHVSEVTVALTVVKRAVVRDATVFAGAAGNASLHVPSPADGLAQESEVRPEKKPDVTIIYRMRAAAAPLATTVFSAPLNLEMATDEEWHWAIVQARGYPPQTLAGSTAHTGGARGDGGEKPVPPFGRNDNAFNGFPPLAGPADTLGSGRPTVPASLNTPLDSQVPLPRSSQ